MSFDTCFSTPIHKTDVICAEKKRKKKKKNTDLTSVGSSSRDTQFTSWEIIVLANAVPYNNSEQSLCELNSRARFAEERIGRLEHFFAETTLGFMTLVEVSTVAVAELRWTYSRCPFGQQSVC